MNKTWYIVTNTENFAHFINYGLIVDKQGFPSNSYITDAMQDIPLGYIPCFTTDSIAPAIDMAKKEDSNLQVCLLELDFNRISQMTIFGGTVEAKYSDNDVGNSAIDRFQVTDLKKLAVREINKETSNCLLLAAPLPFNVIKNVVFQDNQTQEELQKLYEQKFSNFKSKSKFFLTKANLFKKQSVPNKDSNLQPSIEQLDIAVRELSYRPAFLYGGVLGLLYYQTKNGELTAKLFQKFSQLSFENADSELSYASQEPSAEGQSELDGLKSVYRYLFGKATSNIEVVYRNIFSGLQLNDSHGEVCAQILSSLQSPYLPEFYQTKCANLAKSLGTIVDRTNANSPKAILSKIINELYLDDKEFKYFALVVTMFFLRDHVETALKYYHEDFVELHYALLATFYGMVFGVANIPDPIRQSHELSTWLSFKMAEYMHKSNASSAEFKVPIRPPLLYGDFIKPKPTKEYKSQKFYEWLNKSYLKNSDSGEFLTWSVVLPKSYRVEGSNLVSNSKPQVQAILDTFVLRAQIQEQINSDKLFDFNEIIEAYKNETK